MGEVDPAQARKLEEIAQQQRKAPPSQTLEASRNNTKLPESLKITSAANQEKLEEIASQRTSELIKGLVAFMAESRFESGALDSSTRDEFFRLQAATLLKVGA
jgi:hypothetical protein